MYDSFRYEAMINSRGRSCETCRKREKRPDAAFHGDHKMYAGIRNEFENFEAQRDSRDRWAKSLNVGVIQVDVAWKEEHPAWQIHKLASTLYPETSSIVPFEPIEYTKNDPE